MVTCYNNDIILAHESIEANWVRLCEALGSSHDSDLFEELTNKCELTKAQGKYIRLTTIAKSMTPNGGTVKRLLGHANYYGEFIRNCAPKVTHGSY